MKLLICTYQRPDGSTYSDSRRIDEKANPAVAEAAAFAALSASNRDAQLVSRRVGDSTAVRVASKRNTTIGDNEMSPPAEDGRDFHAGVQHSDAVGQLEDAVNKPVDAPEDRAEAATGAVQSEQSSNDAFADLTDDADAGDTPPVDPDDAEAPSAPSRRKK